MNIAEPSFYLVRHAEPQYDLAESKRLKGGVRDWVPLTEVGKTQAFAVAEELLGVDSANYILSSPMTRALHTAAIIAGRIRKPLHVEFDLHEWLPDLAHEYNDFGFVIQQQKELEEHNGEWPLGEVRAWEPLSKLRTRVLSVLSRNKCDKPVIVVCHGMVIYALTGEKLSYGGIAPYTL